MSLCFSLSLFSRLLYEIRTIILLYKIRYHFEKEQTNEGKKLIDEKKKVATLLLRN